MCISAMHILCFLFIFHGRAGYVAALRGNRNPESVKKNTGVLPVFCIILSLPLRPESRFR